jgi:hypothetical protein
MLPAEAVPLVVVAVVVIIGVLGYILDRSA